MKNMLVGAAILSLVTMAAGAANALDVFTTSDSDASVVSTPAKAVLTYSDTGTFSGSWSMTAIASTTGEQSFAFDSQGFYSYYDVVASASATDPTSTHSLYSAGPANCCSAPSAGFDYKGYVTLDLVAGQAYGFTLSGSNYDSAQTLNGTFSVTAAPEPTTWAMMLLGFAGLGLAGYRKTRKSAVAAI